MFKRRKGSQSKKERNFVLERIDKKALKYVTQKDENNTEIVLGKNGAVNIIEGEVVVAFEGSDSLRFKTDMVNVGELMSLDGFVLSGVETGSQKFMKIVGYYKYYR